MDATNPTSEQKTGSLEEAKARIKAMRQAAIEFMDLSRINCATDCLDILARVDPPVGEWQPIATAPKDEEVMVIHKDYGMIQATCYSSMLENAEKAYRDFPWSSPADEEEWIYTKDLTHWMPMPDLPK